MNKSTTVIILLTQDYKGQNLLRPRVIISQLQSTDVARNFNWKGYKRENLVALVWLHFRWRNNADVTEITS